MEATLDPTLTAAPPSSTRSRWAGRVVGGLPVLFLLMDAAMKIAELPPVLEASARLGLPEHTARGTGLLLLACTLLYIVPRTALLGAILLTGYLGGAVAIHVRVEDPLASHTLFPVYVGALCWAGLVLRDGRVRALLGAAR